jgi:hypothetical protein
MADEQDVRLQPLRIPAGWRVVINNFVESADPRLYEGSTRLPNLVFQEDILWMEHHTRDRRIGLDLGWYPEADPTGRFRVVVVELSDDRDKQAASWDTPIASFESRSKAEVIEKVEEFAAFHSSF